MKGLIHLGKLKVVGCRIIVQELPVLQKGLRQRRGALLEQQPPLQVCRLLEQARWSGRAPLLASAGLAVKQSEICRGAL